MHERREIVNALAYWVRAGCAWWLLPHDMSPRRVSCDRLPVA
ncbi:transposase [Nonomuraea sp. LPB2021202275-12-8]